ncbi:DUF4232 domain-containing protein [Streptomyces sp. RPA4-2]|uniref:DUF4232 domain-containing protein n=1 Tax=Streptomyces sp. RPA4-2 TaxID=2721244 RepID=UPI00143E73A0|nr:DUF4232 domain-containing protein [Streptomyces sp. RPA4-2]QIY64442.1 DUF4232 domain-containing protein [Streptomyces sp. RPA4-2]
MNYGTGIRGAALALVSASAATLLMTGCQPGGNATGPAASSAGRPAGGAGSSSTTPATATALTTATAPTTGATATATAATAGCGAGALEASMHQAAVRPQGTGTGAVIVEFTNVSGKPCVVRGRPTVAGAGQGSPQSSHPLQATLTGSVSAVRLAPGGRAWTKLTFVQVQGEGDGYCVSGTRPVTYPTLVVGIPGSGSHQVALEDGVLAECDDRVTVTAVSPAKPS